MRQNSTGEVSFVLALSGGFFHLPSILAVVFRSRAILGPISPPPFVRPVFGGGFRPVLQPGGLLTFWRERVSCAPGQKQPENKPPSKKCHSFAGRRGRSVALGRLVVPGHWFLVMQEVYHRVLDRRRMPVLLGYNG
jgi:hypothetical protein